MSRSITLNTEVLISNLDENHPNVEHPQWVRFKSMYGGETSLSQRRLFKLLDAWSKSSNKERNESIEDFLSKYYKIDKSVAKQWIQSMSLTII